MNNNSSNVYSAIATSLRAAYQGIFITGESINSLPSQFPAVSIVTKNNSINTSYSTFSEIENVAAEEYEVVIYSNLTKGKTAQCEQIVATANEAVKPLHYIRTFCQPVPNADSTIARWIVRFKRNNVI